MVLLLSNCAKTGAADCILFSPVYISKEDQLTDGTARQILENNRTGKKECKWQHSKKPSN
jgi:hypothetical protein